MADGADRLLGPERVDGHLLHLGALEIRTHPARPVPAGQYQRVVGAPPGRAPMQRRGERLVFPQRRVGGTGVGVGPQDAADDGHATQARDEAPGVEALPRHHQVVGHAPLPGRRGEHHVMPRRGQHLPADRHLGRVETAAGRGMRTVTISARETTDGHRAHQGRMPRAWRGRRV